MLPPARGRVRAAFLAGLRRLELGRSERCVRLPCDRYQVSMLIKLAQSLEDKPSDS